MDTNDFDDRLFSNANNVFYTVGVMAKCIETLIAGNAVTDFLFNLQFTRSKRNDVFLGIANQVIKLFVFKYISLTLPLKINYMSII
jgi:hypothetical protein